MADWQGKRRMSRRLGKFRKRGENGEKKREREREFLLMLRRCQLRLVAELD